MAFDSVNDSIVNLQSISYSSFSFIPAASSIQGDQASPSDLGAYPLTTIGSNLITPDMGSGSFSIYASRIDIPIDSAQAPVDPVDPQRWSEF